MESAANKSLRLLQTEQLLLAHPQGISRAEIARRLGVNRSTAKRYIDELSAQIPIWEDGNLVGINRDDYNVDIRLTIHESAALHLATRLMATRMDKHNPHAVTALRKLGQALDKFAPFISHHLLASADVMDDAAQRRDPNYLRVLEILTRAWSEGRMTHVWHKHEETGKIFEYDFAPYFIEPYAVGQTVHVIGLRQPPGKIRTFKLERLQRAELLPQETYTIPVDFDPQKYLADAWGIWYSEAEPVEVVLRFHPRVAGRVEETRWHRKEITEWQPDGYLLWRARIAEPQEMLPWIRGWGGDCEIQKPVGLRRKLAREARRMVELYNAGLFTAGNFQDDPLLPFDSPARPLWAKTDMHNDQEEEIHPLICHLIDVAQVVCALWDKALPLATRRYFMETLGLDEGTTRQWLAFLAGLHDLGKASPTFQKMYQPAQARLEKLGFNFPESAKAPHGTVSTWALRRLFAAHCALSGEMRHNVSVAIGGHHGAWPTPREVNMELGPGQYGEGLWEEARRSLFMALAQSLGLAELKQLSLPEEEDGNIFCMALAGLISVADWLGSMTEFFTFAPLQVKLESYREEAYQQAVEALDQLGWSSWSPPEKPLPFEQLFPFQPRPLQQAVTTLIEAEQPAPPALVIIEAPTGEGKTEAAWYLADTWLARHQQRGVYVAMPTQATSNQMLRRVWQFIERRYPGEKTNLILLHGDAAWSEDMRRLRLAAVNEDELSTVAAHAWFLPKKRSLLAPFAVGTVDQALLATLQTRHFFVRMFGLSHKTVIFDEIHAYDTYMNVLFRRLLRWLAAMGSSVILLSATLPAKVRAELIEAYTGRLPEQVVQYPALSWGTAAGSSARGGVIPLDTSQGRTVALAWLAQEPETLIKMLRQALQDGGCMAVICNTVEQAQAFYRLLAEAQLVPVEDLLLFHARFPFYLRQQIEAEVLERFGKDGQRPRRSIVVATQVIEQSLDLDFDLMVSYLAPADLVLQRMGRLHRHDHPNRPASLQKPQFWLLAPPASPEQPPRFGSDGLVYAPYILLRSYLALHGLEQITIPDDVQGLIEAVYGLEAAAEASLSPAWGEALAEARSKVEADIAKQEHAARQNLIYGPDDEDLLRQESRKLEEDKPDLHTALQALTRLTRPTITLICLHQIPAGLALEPDGPPAITLEEIPDWEATQRLVERKVTLSHPAVVRHFAWLDPPTSWQKQASLRHFRPAIFTAGRCPAGDGLWLIFDLKQGILIRKEV